MNYHFSPFKYYKHKTRPDFFVDKADLQPETHFGTAINSKPRSVKPSLVSHLNAEAVST
jgi:hypothetical protein